MMDTPWDVWREARLAGQEAKLQHPGDDDTAKAHRSVEAYKWFILLCQHYKRADALLMLDPHKGGEKEQPTIFGVSERNVRRIETIRKLRPKQAARLEEMAMHGLVSLETIEHLALHPSPSLVEVVWLILDNS